MAYEHLKTMLREAGKTQADLAGFLNKTPAVITNLFQGVRQLKALEAEKIAEWLQLPVTQILNNSDHSVPVIGSIGDGAKVSFQVSAPHLQEGFREKDAAFTALPRAVLPLEMPVQGRYAFTIKGDACGFAYPDGATVFCQASIKADFDRYVGERVIVGLDNGQYYFVILKPGFQYGKYTLLKLDGSGVAAENVAVTILMLVEGVVFPPHK